MRSPCVGTVMALLLAACSAAGRMTTVTEGSTTSTSDVTATTVATATTTTTSTSLGGGTVEFERALLRVEINSTDGDAGLQIDLDHEPWTTLGLTAPGGSKLLDVVDQGVLDSYGLTELFSESSEPPFTDFPLDEFMKLFPAGEYVFEGKTVDGVRMRSTFTLTHDFPAGPEILSPEEDATVPPDDLVVEWAPVREPAGIEIVRYQVLVINEENPLYEFSATVPAGVTGLTVPTEFLAINGKYKVEVLAIEVSGNQTLSELAFIVG